MSNKKGYWAGAKNPKYKHGYAHLRAYRIWYGMIRRCTDPRSSLYKRYGACGISVAKRWQNFTNFYDDMGDPPNGTSIERLNNKAGYSKANCIWATRERQANNCRDSVKLTHCGSTLTLSQWARRIGIRRSTLQKRLDQKWPLKDVLSSRKWLPREYAND